MLLQYSKTASASKLAHIAALASATVMATIALEANSARAEDLIVNYDQAQLLRLPRPVAEVIVGNPSIAEATVSGGNLVVVTGKTHGITNVIALDGDRNVIQDQRVVVERDQGRMIHLSRGGMMQTYSCTPHCSSVLMIGDDKDYWEVIMKQSMGKTKFSDQSGDGNNGGGQN